ncbi:MAG: hypothetical protein IPM54_04135 [Polyangiaceae bacterium]|nr:hypothetical protein [Polyangiaceae bacterium]
MSQHDTHGSGGQYEVDEHAAGDDDAPEGVSLEQTAEIEAYLAVFVDEPRDAVLGRFDMDEDRFCNAKKVWAERIEDEVLRASAPGQRIAAAEKYRLSMRYSVAYSKAAERAREDAAAVQGDGELEGASASLGSGGMLRLGSGHE